jgi:Tol biopolymer transport system component/DNA-binding winged helix-turn-helix (wHTH) protein
MPDVFVVGDWRVDPSLRTVTGPSGEAHLEPKLMQVLLLLAEHQGQVISKERLLQTVWPDTFVGDDVLSRAISELRRVFGDDSRAPRYIQTIPKNGYRLVAPVSAMPPALRRPSAISRRVSFHAVGWALAATAISILAVWAVVQWRRTAHSQRSDPLRTVRFTSGEGDESSPTFSPDGSRMAFDGAPAEGGPSHIFLKMAVDDPPVELTHGPGIDGGPSWSPDGRSIAFSRVAGEKSGIYLVSSLGGIEHRVWSAHWSNIRESCWCRPNWSPDGKHLIFAAAPEHSAGTAAATSMPLCRITELSLETMAARPLTGPPAYGFDSMPAYSPDGRTIAFVRYRTISMADMFLMPSGGGSPRQLTHDDAELPGNLAWTPDGREIVFASNRGGTTALWRVAIAGGEPQPVQVSGNELWSPAIDAGGHRLAFEEHIRDCNLYAIDLRQPDRPASKVAPSTLCEHGPQFSPDGRKLAFERTDIWVADADGANPVRLTFTFRGSGTPRWSADGERIAFESSEGGKYGVSVVRVDGGAPTRLTDDGFVPSWSRDGRWIYFGSGRTGSDQIWKVPAAGGSPVQVTRHGGFGGFESSDGRYLYYTKHSMRPGIWRVPVEGGHEEPVLADEPVAGYSRFFALVDDGIYFLDAHDGQHQSVAFFDLATKQKRDVATLPRPATPWASGLAVSPDRRTVVVALQERDESDIMLVENFH